MTSEKKKKKRGKKATTEVTQLRVIRTNVAGIDIGSTEHWVCGPPRGDGVPNVRRFATTTDQLHELTRWLHEQGVESVVMESTSIYWIPIYELLESRGMNVQLVNARQLHNVPGRKTDVSDCQWLQLLHGCGLLRGSFRPVEAITRMRATYRHMDNLVAERTRCIQWMQKALDQMNVQVHRAVTDITGLTGMAILRAIVDGERDPLKLAAHRDRRCKKSKEQIACHLTGTWREEHLFSLGSALRLYDTVEREIAQCQSRLLEDLQALHPEERRKEPVPTHPNKTKASAIKRLGEHDLRTALWRFAGVDLTRIDGIGPGTAQVIISEVGADLARFPTENHFVSWLRLCSRTPISGGKPLKKRRNGLGASRVSMALRNAATAVQRSGTALGASYRRVARRRGAGVAIFRGHGRSRL
jgi:transposase